MKKALVIFAIQVFFSVQASTEVFAQPGDMAAITRRANAVYDLQIIKCGSDNYKKLKKYLIHDIGNRGKRYGYVTNEIFDDLMGSLQKAAAVN